MSGMCGLVRLDGAPVNRGLLGKMTSYLAFRGPDGCSTWSEIAAGLGHTLLATTFEAQHERQPLSLDGKIWIAADARIDGRPQLKTELAAAGRQVVEPVNDAELILHAYHAWGERCLSRLIGDFVFAIWDGPVQTLFCARDHFGVKPFFFAQIGQEVIFSNTLDCIRHHPGVSDRLNDLAISDFLLFESNQDPATTAFADIQRIPPGHQLVCAGGSLRLKRYWSVPDGLGVRYRDKRDYVAHFKFLLQQAVADRLRTDTVGVAMSGGLDSTAIAATAAALLQHPSTTVRAHSVVFEHLLPDRERHFASMAAAHIGIPIDFIVGDRYNVYQGQRDGSWVLPEPLHSPAFAMHLDATKLAAAHSRVVLTGWDGDALLTESPKPYFRSLFKERRFLPMLAGVARYALSERRLPHNLRNLLRRRGPDPAQSNALPPWINSALADRLDLQSRLRERSRDPHSSHPIRPNAFRSFTHLSDSCSFFDIYDAAWTRRALEYRHPLLDLRLLDYCLSVPPFPWCVKKHILRTATDGSLPDLVRSRPKTPLAGSPFPAMLQRREAEWIDSFHPNPQLCEYLDGAMIPRAVLRRAGQDPDQNWIDLRPLSLNLWLNRLSKQQHLHSF